MPDLDSREVRDRLGSRRGFAWLKRDISPAQQAEVHRLGIPGIGFLTENKRVYPNGNEVSHLIGHVNIDNQGIAGIERWLDSHGLATSIVPALPPIASRSRYSLRLTSACSMRCATN